MNVFLSCVSEKEDYKCQAKDLYISPLFQKSYAYAQKLKPDNIYILSAKYYVLDLDEEVEPYDITLKDMSADEKRDWVDKVLEKLDEKGIDKNEKTVFLAGHSYLDYLVEHFTDYSIPYQENELGGIGYILEWLDKQIGKEEAFRIQKMCDEKIGNKLINKMSDKMNDNKINRLKLAKLLMKFAEIQTDKGVLTYEGELGIGTELFIERDGELVPVDNGEYLFEDKKIRVEDGKVAEILEVEQELEEQVENPTNEGEETDNEAIVKLREEVNELFKRVNELEKMMGEKVEEMSKKLEMSTAKPAHQEVKDVKLSKENKVLKYFGK